MWPVVVDGNRADAGPANLGGGWTLENAPCKRENTQTLQYGIQYLYFNSGFAKTQVRVHFSPLIYFSYEN